MSANNTFLRLSLASVLIGSMLGMPAVVCASSPAQTTSEVQQNTNVSSEIVKLWVQRERQKFCVHGIIGARQTGASNEHEHQTQFS